MGGSDVLDQINALISRLKAVGWKEREAVKQEVLAFVIEHKSDTLLDHLNSLRKGLPLEVRWEIDEVIEAVTPPPEPEPEPEAEPEPEPEPEDGQLRMSDLVEVYADPRGIALFTSKSGERWFLSQPDPYTGQPAMAELTPADVDKVKAQLMGSPYWRIGSGIAP